MRTKAEKIEILKKVISGELPPVVLKPRKVKIYFGNLDMHPELNAIGINKAHPMSVNGKPIPTRWMFDNLFNPELIKGRDDSDLEVVKL